MVNKLVHCPTCKTPLNLRDFKEHRDSVRRGFFAGWSRSKGIASMVMVLMFAMLLIAIMGIALGKASAGTPTEPLDVAQQIVPLIFPK